MNEQRDEAAPGSPSDDDEVLGDVQPDTDGESWADVELPSSGSAEDDLQGLVTFIVSHLLDSSDEVEVEAEQRGSSVHLRLRVPAEDLGKVIGRQGRVARAMRTALTIAGSRHNVRASLDIEG